MVEVANSSPDNNAQKKKNKKIKERNHCLGMRWLEVLPGHFNDVLMVEP